MICKVNERERQWEVKLETLVNEQVFKPNCLLREKHYPYHQKFKQQFNKLFLSSLFNDSLSEAIEGMLYLGRNEYFKL